MTIGAYIGGGIALILLGRLLYKIFTDKPKSANIAGFGNKRKVVVITILAISISLFVASGCGVLSINFRALASALIGVSFGVAVL